MIEYSEDIYDLKKLNPPNYFFQMDEFYYYPQYNFKLYESEKLVDKIENTQSSETEKMQEDENKPKKILPRKSKYYDDELSMDLSKKSILFFT